MAKPIIALLTDFGTRDHYAGTMKGVALGICPDATLVDITHEIAPHDILGGALELAAAVRYFPAGTIFLVVIDPGVGSARRGLAVDSGDYRFVAPDNGVLTLALRDLPPKHMVELSDRRYARPTVSRTFEGRDRFAPAAAWLAKGTDLAALGRPVKEFHRLTVPEPVFGDAGPGKAALTGEILRVDRFGNLISNIDRKTFDRRASGVVSAITVGGHEVARLVTTYSEAEAGEVCALFGSTDHLEVAENGGSAAARLGLGRGAEVRVTVAVRPA
ncbi:MAG: SAM-dependent chlorinase/fluorinase [Vicinamibacterales bacterium]